MNRFAVIAIFGSSIAFPSTAQILLATENPLSVDVSKIGAPINKYGMGFISNSAQFNADNSRKPQVGLMEPVVPHLIRSSSNALNGAPGVYTTRTFYTWKDVSIITKKPLTYQIVLSDSWPYNYSPNRDPQTLNEWFSIVKSLLDNPIKDFILDLNSDVKSGRIDPPQSKNFGDYFQIDIWNEPAEFFAQTAGKNESDFYRYPTNDYYKAFDSVWVKTKTFIDAYFQNCTWCKNLGSTGTYSFTPPIVGPSFSGYNDYYLKKFYADTKSQGVKPDVLSWHSIDNFNMRELENNIGTMKSMIAGDLTGLCVNEWSMGGTSDPTYQLKYVNPAINLRFLSVLERQAVPGSKACWALPNDENPCTGASIGGSLTFPNSDAPRSMWWVFEHFNRLSGNRLAMNFFKKNEIEKLDGVASFDASKSEGWIMVGNYDSERKEPLTLTLKGLTENVAFRNKTMVVDLEIIDNAALSAYSSPRAVYSGKAYSLRKDALALNPIMLAPGSIAYYHFSIH